MAGLIVRAKSDDNLLTISDQCLIITNQMTSLPLDIWRRLNVHKTIRRRPGHLLNALCAFNWCPVTRRLGMIGTLISIGFWNALIPVNIYLFKVNNRSSRKSCEICSKLTIKTQEEHQTPFLCSLLTLDIF